MTKLSDFSQIAQLVEQRKRLVEKLENVSNWKPHDNPDVIDDMALGVTIRGTYQGSEIVAAARGGIVNLLESRLRDMDSKLQTLGLEVNL
jgi:hypothetical protein